MKKIVGLLVAYLIILIVFVDFKLTEINSNDLIYVIVIWCILCLSVFAFYTIDKYIARARLSTYKSILLRVIVFAVVLTFLTGIFYSFDLNQKMSVTWFYSYPIGYIVVSIIKFLNSVSSKIQ